MPQKIKPKQGEQTAATPVATPVFNAEPSVTVQALQSAPFFWLVFFSLTVLALALRIWNIEARPLHSDEGVNFWFIETIRREQVYRYSHENYHGPLFFYLLTAFYTLVGDTVLGMRALSIFCGTLLLAVPLRLRKLEGDYFVLAAVGLLALSPSMVFHSRYAIHEMLFILGTACFATSLYIWTLTENKREVYWLVFSLWLLVATKETFCITGFCLVLAILSISSPKKLWNNFRNARQQIAWALLGFSLLFVAVYTGGFRLADGLWEVLRSIPQWIGRSKSDVGHHKPWNYYWQNVILPTEPYLYVGLALGLYFLVKNQSKFLRYTAVWWLSTLAIYSYVPYKTPWLIINITLPAILFLARVFAELLLRTGPTVANICFGVTLLVAGVNTILFNYGAPGPAEAVPPSPYGLNFSLAQLYPYGKGNPFSYVHTSPGMMELVKDVQAYGVGKEKLKIMVGMEGYFPLPYYFRKNLTSTAYQVLKTNAEIDNASNTFDVLILDFRTTWQNPAWEKKYYRLSDYAESVTFFRKPPEAISQSDQSNTNTAPQ